MDTGGSRSELPLTPPLLLEVLQAACSPNQELIQQATAQLKKWETSKGYFSLLQDAFYDKSLPLEIRWISVIQLKNGVDKYWRNTQPNAISKEEKAGIRSKLLDSIDEESPQLAKMNAVLVAKVARIDYPNHWPDLFHTLVGAIREMASSAVDGNATNPRLRAAMQLLLAIIREQATVRIQRTRANLLAIAPEIFRVLGELYVKYVTAWTPRLGQDAGGENITENMLTISLLILKTLRRLLVAGYEFPNRSEEVREFWTILRGQLTTFIQLTCGPSTSLPEEQTKILRKHVINFGKLYQDVASTHAAAFALLPDTIEVIRTYWQVILAYGEELGANQEKIRARLNSGEAIEGSLVEDPDRSKYVERVALHGGLLLRACAKMIFNPTQTFRYKHEQEKKETAEAKELFKTQLFTPEMVTQCMEVLVTRYFVLTPTDIEEWGEDPEGWSVQMEDTTESWEFLIRPCAEKLFNDLINWFKDLLVQPLVNVFNASSNQDILTKDAIYTAIGLGAAVLHHSINFDAYLQNTLVDEVQISQPGYNIIRRRIAILIGQWVPVKISVDVRSTIYKITQHLLNREDPLNDLVVRFAAARNLKCSIDEWDFKMDDFLPYVDDLFTKVLSLIDEVEQTETKMTLLGVISVIVERLADKVAPYADRIVEILPPLWDQTGEEHLFKQAILAVLTKLVSAMKEKSMKYSPLLIKIIRFSVEPGPMQVYLLEEALELWDALVKATPAPASPEMLDLAQLLLPCLETGSETLKRILDVTEGYVLLAPREIISTFGLPLFRNLTELLGTIKPEASSIVTTIVEIILRIADLLGGEGALQEVVSNLLTSGFLSKVISAIHESYKARQTTGPNKSYSRINTLIETHYFELLARLALANPDLFIKVIIALAPQRSETHEETLKWILDEWCTHFQNIGHPRPRKLNCLALTALLRLGDNRLVLGRLQDLMTIWTDVITELRDDDIGSGSKDPANPAGETLIYWPTSDDPDSLEGGGVGGTVNPERKRRNELSKCDPVNTVAVVAFVRNVLLGGVMESEGWREAVEAVDREVLQGFGGLAVV